MSKSSEILLKKKSERDTCSLIESVNGLKLIDVFDIASLCYVNSKVVEASSLETEPHSEISSSENLDILRRWAVEQFSRLDLEKEAVVCVGDSGVPVWCEVGFELPENTLLTLWEKSESKELLVLNQHTKKLLAIYNEEYKFASFIL